METLLVKKLTETAIMPTKAHKTDAGFDLYADEDMLIWPGQTVKVKTGIAVRPDAPYAYYTLANLIWDRSSLGSKGIHRLAGVIDQTYTGEVMVILTNLNTGNILASLIDVVSLLAAAVRKSSIFLDSFTDVMLSVDKQINTINKEYQPYKINKGDKIAQIITTIVPYAELVETTEFPESDRGEKGFGSSGK